MVQQEKENKGETNRMIRRKSVRTQLSRVKKGRSPLRLYTSGRGEVAQPWYLEFKNTKTVFS